MSEDIQQELTLFFDVGITGFKSIGIEVIMRVPYLVANMILPYVGGDDDFERSGAESAFQRMLADFDMVFFEHLFQPDKFVNYGSFSFPLDFDRWHFFGNDMCRDGFESGF